MIFDRLPNDERARALASMMARDAYERHLTSETLGVLEAAFDDIAAQLRDRPLSLRERARLSQRYEEVQRQLAAAYGEVSRLTHDRLASFGPLEGAAAQAELRARVEAAGGDAAAVDVSTSLLARGTVRSIAALPIDGLPLGDWWTMQARGMALATRRAIQTGLVLGEGPDQIARRIVPARGSADPAVWRQARRDAAAVVRTSVTAVHNDAALRAYAAESDDVTAEYELVTARDNRVSKICAALDGLVFRYDDPRRKQPPFHINCRTTTVPVLNYAALGMKKPGKRSPLNFPSFDGWLRHQDAGVQRDVLGASRQAMYERGELSLRQLVDEDTRELSLEQLRTRYGIAA